MADDPTTGAEIEHLSTQAGYDRWSELYDVDDNPLTAIEEPKVVELLGPVDRMRVADIGCGTGRHALRLAAAGAAVDAVDFSAGMLARAEANAGDFGIQFHEHDLHQPLPFPDGRFDRVVCGLVLDHITDLTGLLGEMHRICHPTGFVIISVMHPAMTLRGIQARFRDPDTGREVRPASINHQISDYVMAAQSAGFTFDHLSEHLVDEELVARRERARKHLGWPLLLLMQLSPTVRNKRLE